MPRFVFRQVVSRRSLPRCLVYDRTSESARTI
jgi:hypothetical protein